MKIAVVFPCGLWSAWGMADGICTTLVRMGHDVLSIPRGSPKAPSEISAREINQCDLAIFSGPEHYLVGDVKSFMD